MIISTSKNNSAFVKEVKFGTQRISPKTIHGGKKRTGFLLADF
jgi:hypothetical protein